MGNRHLFLWDKLTLKTTEANQNFLVSQKTNQLAKGAAATFFIDTTGNESLTESFSGIVRFETRSDEVNSSYDTMQSSNPSS